MPSGEHEGVVAMMRSRPEVVPGILDVLGVDVPQHIDARPEAEDATSLVPTEHRADAVVALRDAQDKPVLVVVIEMQRSRDGRKQWVWPVYLTTLRARHECPAVLVVICPSAGVARWASAPVPMGHPRFVLEPLVVGPDVIPQVTDVELAREKPWLAVLSALAHGEEPGLTALRDALQFLDQDVADKYVDVALSAFPEAMIQHLERAREMGIYDYKSDFGRKCYGQGLAAGEAKALIAMLEVQGIPVSPEAHQRITECADPDQLLSWVKQAATIRSADELFGG